MSKDILILTALLSAVVVSGASAAEDPGTSLTIYSQAQPGAVSPDLYRPVAGRSGWAGSAVPGYAVVRQDRGVELSRGRSTLAFSDVAALIDPTTVRFSSLTDPEGTRVLEQDFRFDLVGTDRLLERYLDLEITVHRGLGEEAERITGKLMSTSGGLVLGMPDGSVEIVNGYNRIEFPQLPGGLITRPTLVWDVLARRGGTHRSRVAYQTAGITWWADYNLTWSEGANANEGRLDIGAWVSIVNQSGASYEQARLKLIAGDVQRAEQPRYAAEARRQVMMAAMEDAAGFEEKSFFEFHLYTLGRSTTIPDRSTKQLELFPSASGVPAQKLLVYDGRPGYAGIFGGPQTDRDYGVQSNPKVDVYLEFTNSEKNGLGIPLPSGRIRVSQLDEADGSLEFIGGDLIDHTPKNQDVRIRLGSAFDVVGERRQTDFQVDTRAHWMEEEIEIILTNRKEEEVDVVVRELLHRWSSWQLITATDSWDKIDARTIHLPVTVPADGKRTVRYRVRYTW